MAPQCNCSHICLQSEQSPVISREVTNPLGCINTGIWHKNVPNQTCRGSCSGDHVGIRARQVALYKYFHYTLCSLSTRTIVSGIKSCIPELQVKWKCSYMLSYLNYCPECCFKDLHGVLYKVMCDVFT